MTSPLPLFWIVIPGPVPGTHDLRYSRGNAASLRDLPTAEIMGGRDKPGHDDPVWGGL